MYDVPYKARALGCISELIVTTSERARTPTAGSIWEDVDTKKTNVVCTYTLFGLENIGSGLHFRGGIVFRVIQDKPRNKKQES